jgi:hypothetical protein
MNIFRRVFNTKTNSVNQKSVENAGNSLTVDEYFHSFYNRQHCENFYSLNAWVNIAVNILIRNIARADFTVKNGGEDVTHGSIFELFRKPNPALSRFDLWKETAAWWFLEGEAFWWFGSEYSGGIPKEIFALDPRDMRHEGELYGGLDFSFRRIAPVVLSLRC